MSGGHFNYSQNRINDVVEHLEYLLDDEEAQERRDTYSDATLQKFKEAADILKKAFVYTQRIDWLLSGDDSEETFHERLEEDLGKIEPDFVRVGDGTLHGAIDYWQDRASKANARLDWLLSRVGVDRFGEVFETASGNKEESKHYIDEAIRYIRGIEGS